MTLTNQELAKNPLFSVTLGFLACPKCNYVAKLDQLINPQVPCPKCRALGIARQPFPDVSALQPIKMVQYFYAKACNRIEDLKVELVNDIREKVGRVYDPQVAVETAREVQNFYEEHGEEQCAYDKILDIIQECLSLQSREEAIRIFVPLFKYSDTFEEHKVVVILTCTLLDKLFDDLLVLLLRTRKGMNWSKAEKKIGNLRKFDERRKKFKELTGFSLEEAIGQSSISNFFQHWKDIRKLGTHLFMEVLIQLEYQQRRKLSILLKMLSPSLPISRIAFALNILRTAAYNIFTA